MNLSIVGSFVILMSLLPAAGEGQDSGLHRTLKVGPGGDLRVSLAEGNVRVSGWDRNEVAVRVNGASDEESGCLDVSQQGNTVRVSIGGGCDFSELEISVPSKFNIDIRTASGDIEVNGPLTGSIRGSTSGGGIQLGNLGGRVEMQTAGGDISAGDIQGDADLATQGGNVSVGKVSGTTEITSSGGDISVSGSGGRLKVHTSGGNITIGNVGATADVETTGGDVEVGDVAGNVTIATAGGNIALRSSHGTTSASTAGGDIRLESVIGSVNAETAGGNVVARLTPHGRSNLSSNGGEIGLYLPADAKVTVNARVILSDEDAGGSVGIESDFPIDNAVRSESGVIIEGSIKVNGGGDTVQLETRDGRILVRKGKIRD